MSLRVYFHTNDLDTSGFTDNTSGKIFRSEPMIFNTAREARAEYERRKRFGSKRDNVLLGDVFGSNILKDRQETPVSFKNISKISNTSARILCGNDDPEWWTEHVLKWLEIADMLPEGEEVHLIEPVASPGSTNAVMPGVPVRIVRNSHGAGAEIHVYAMRAYFKYVFRSCEQYDTRSSARNRRRDAMVKLGLSKAKACDLIDFAFMLKTAQAMGVNDQAVIDFDRKMYAQCQLFSEELELNDALS